MPKLLLLLGATAHAFVAPRARLRPHITLHADTSARVVDAVEELNGVVTAGDVAARGAAPLVSAERELLALAARHGAARFVYTSTIECTYAVSYTHLTLPTNREV